MGGNAADTAVDDCCAQKIRCGRTPSLHRDARLRYSLGSANILGERATARVSIRGEKEEWE